MTLTMIQIQVLGYHQEYNVDAYFLSRKVNKDEILELEDPIKTLQMFKRIDGELFLAYTLLSMNCRPASCYLNKQYTRILPLPGITRIVHVFLDLSRHLQDNPQFGERITEKRLNAAEIRVYSD